MSKKQTISKGLWIGKDGVVLSDYQFDFLLLLKEKEARKVLRKFLEKELNTEPLDFLEDYNRIMDQKNENESVNEEAIKNLSDILKTFVEMNSTKELNINLQTRKKVMNGFEALKSQSVTTYGHIEQLFHPLKHVVILELHSDNFQRFIRCDVWKSFITKQDKSFIEKIGEKKGVLDYPYRDDDFVGHVVAEKDFEFMEKLAQDNYDWELQGHKISNEGSIHGYWRSNNLLCNVSWSKSASIAKFVGIFNYSVEFIAQTIFPGYNIPVFDRNVRSYHQHLYYGNDELRKKYGEKIVKDRSCAVVSFDIEVPIPLAAKRRYLFCVSSKYDGKNEEFILLNKPCLLDSEKLKKGWIEFKDFMYYRLRKIDENKTQYTQIHVYNMFGWAQNQSLNKYIVWDRAKALQKSILDILQKQKEGKLKPLDRNDYFVQLYFDAMEQKKKYHIQHQIDANSIITSSASTSSSSSLDTTTIISSTIPATSGGTTTSPTSESKSINESRIP